MDGRDDAGRFQRGCPPGPGRPSRPTERAYLLALGDACSLDDWHAICARAVSDAKEGDATARSWLASYLVGRAVAEAPVLADVAIVADITEEAIELTLRERVERNHAALSTGPVLLRPESLVGEYPDRQADAPNGDLTLLAAAD